VQRLRGDDLLTPDEREELAELRLRNKKMASDLDKAKKVSMIIYSIHSMMFLVDYINGLCVAFGT
jgi:hypothetical protein